MEEMLKIIGEYGILIVIAAAFIWDKVTHAKTSEKMLKELETNAKLQTALLERHDKRSEYMNNDVREICTLLRVRPCLTQRDEEFN